MTMKLARRVFLSIALAAALHVPLQAAAQSGTEVHDLTDAELTEEQLIELLKPTAPEPLRERGVAVSGGRPKCTVYRQQATRGIAVASASTPVAIQVFFAYNSAELLPEAARNLDRLGKALASDVLGSSCFRIEGHTDSTGSDLFNRGLSERRAQTVVRYLASKFGLDPDRLLAVGYGEHSPMASNEDEAGRSRNRRVQVVNLGYGRVEP